MIAYPCTKDRVVFKVPTLDPQVRILNEVIPCPLCGDQLTVSHDLSDNLTTRVMTATELFQASSGLGLPDFQQASLERVRHCLEGSTVVSIQAQEITPTRVLVESITVNGSTNDYVIHFGSSTRGATIFKITENSP